MTMFDERPHRLNEEGGSIMLSTVFTILAVTYCLSTLELYLFTEGEGILSLGR